MLIKVPKFVVEKDAKLIPGLDGQKMSKSLGNMIPLREMPIKFSVDSSRLTILF